MRLPILELDGYEADDVIGCLAQKAAKQNLDVLLITNDKDMMQLVDGSVRVLRTGPGGAKGDVIVGCGACEEILGVPPDKVVDVMSLMGDTIDNIPGAKGIGEKGAKELIPEIWKRGKCTGARGEVSNKRYREALQQQREQVFVVQAASHAGRASCAGAGFAEPGAARTGLERALSALPRARIQFLAARTRIGGGGRFGSGKCARCGDGLPTVCFRCGLSRVFCKRCRRRSRWPFGSIWKPVSAKLRDLARALPPSKFPRRLAKGGQPGSNPKGEVLHTLAESLGDAQRPKSCTIPNCCKFSAAKREISRTLRRFIPTSCGRRRPTTIFSDVVMRQFTPCSAELPRTKADYLPCTAGPGAAGAIEAQQLETVLRKNRSSGLPPSLRIWSVPAPRGSPGAGTPMSLARSSAEHALNWPHDHVGKLWLAVVGRKR